MMPKRKSILNLFTMIQNEQNNKKEVTTFVCDKCGICCKNISGIPELSCFDNGNGICIHLSEDNLCNIYSNRPVWCNVMQLYAEKYADIMSEEAWIALNQQSCLQLKSGYLNK